MSVYKKLYESASKYVGKDKIFKYGFNWSPMYRRSTARIKTVSKDMLSVTIKLPISYKNRNYANTIFGGSMYAATDPIYMIQLISILGDDYVVWDKSAEIRFKKPATENLYGDFIFTLKEVDDILQQVEKNKEVVYNKHVFLTNKNKSITYCEVKKELYIAKKSFYKEKIKKRKMKK